MDKTPTDVFLLTCLSGFAGVIAFSCWLIRVLFSQSQRVRPNSGKVLLRGHTSLGLSSLEAMLQCIGETM